MTVEGTFASGVEEQPQRFQRDACFQIFSNVLGMHLRGPVLHELLEATEPSPPVEIPEHSWAALHHVQDRAILVDQFVGILERPPNHSSCERGVGHRAACLGARGLPELRLVLCLLKAKCAF